MNKKENLQYSSSEMSLFQRKTAICSYLETISIDDARRTREETSIGLNMCTTQPDNLGNKQTHKSGMRRRRRRRKRKWNEEEEEEEDENEDEDEEGKKNKKEEKKNK